MIFRYDHRDWTAPVVSAKLTDAAVELEAGAILLLPDLSFDAQKEERILFSPSMATAKNVSFDPRTDRIGGSAASGREGEVLRGWLRRFSHAADALVASLLPWYGGRLERARASFRPVEIAGRSTSWRHDDTRLHIDSFPATPVQGRRILRVFTNVNPDGRPRSWRVGEPFERVAARFCDHLRLPRPFSGTLLRLARVTRSRRSPYDALMLQLHDRMKADVDYQSEAEQEAVDFPAGATWIAFTDEVSHAAMSGQYQLEQTFLLPIEAMHVPERSPLRILERLKGRRLTP